MISQFDVTRFDACRAARLPRLPVCRHHRRHQSQRPPRPRPHRRRRGGARRRRVHAEPRARRAGRARRGQRQSRASPAPSSSTAATPTPAPATRASATPRRWPSMPPRAIGCDPQRVLVASTGVIGQPLPIERIVRGDAATLRRRAPRRARRLRAGDHDHRSLREARAAAAAAGAEDAGARRRRRQGRRHDRAQHGHHAWPSSAPTPPSTKTFLRTVLREEVESTFNAISVDGDTSTNDMVAIMASGAAKNPPIDGGDEGRAFRRGGARRARRAGAPDRARRRGRDPRGHHRGRRRRHRRRRRRASRAASRSRRCARPPSSAPIPTGAASSPPSATPASTSIRAGSTSPSARSRSAAPASASAVKPSVRAHEVMRRGEYTIRVHLNRGARARKACHLRSHRRLRQAQRRLSHLNQRGRFDVEVASIVHRRTPGRRGRWPLVVAS